MKALGVTAPDFVPRLFDVDEPTAGYNEVVVDVMASPVTEFDRAAVRGHYRNQERRLAPVLLGRDFVGRVAAVGDNVGYIDVGMYVAGVLAPQTSGQMGTFADKVAVTAELLAPVPEGIDLTHVAGVGLAGISASDAVGTLRIRRSESILIQGPVSGAGGFAVQLAKARGAVVVALTLPQQADLAWQFGADVVISEGANQKHAVETVRDLFGGGVDSAIHVAGDLSTAAAVVRPGGKFTSVSGATAPVTYLHSDFVPAVITPNGHKLADLLFKVAALRLHSHVSTTLSFDQVGDALNSRNDAERVVLVR
jgi:NADPH:quinone reductase-like Zn-dependent oxidoreductase